MTSDHSVITVSLWRLADYIHSGKREKEMYVSCEANTWFCKKEQEAEHDCKTVAKVEMA